MVGQPVTQCLRAKCAARRRRACRGQSVVEFALALPLLVLLIFGIIDFGRALNVVVILSNAAREGARAGIARGATDDEIRTRAQAIAGLAGNVTVEILPGPRATLNSGQTLTVRVRTGFSPVTPLLAALLPGGSIPLQAQASRVVE
jgi:Flp pilus assembly protein TadG